MSDSDLAVETSAHTVQLTASLIAAYVGHNTVALEALPDLIRSVHASLSGLTAAGAGEAQQPPPAVPVKKSVHPDFLICLEDGKKLKMLKRHLQTAYNMTPDEYRARWNLPADYPMVAPNYTHQRSVLAKQIGLGRSKAAAPAEPPPSAPQKRRRKTASA